jgi:hypothetical protein
MTKQQDKYQRAILPIPDRPHTGLTTYDAKDPNTEFPPIEPVQPPEGAPNVHETGTAVAPECDVQGSEFSGEINWVELKVGEDDHGHLVDPEEYIKVLMARQ